MIRFENITKQYNQKTVIRDFNLDIEEGQLVVFIGPSGCGKTTLLKMINRLLEPTSGKIYVNEKDISKQDPIELRRNIGYVIQSTGLFPHMTIKENLELIPKLKGKIPIQLNGKPMIFLNWLVWHQMNIYTDIQVS